MRITDFARVGRHAMTTALITSMLLGTGALLPLAPQAQAEDTASLQNLDENLLAAADTDLDSSDAENTGDDASSDSDGDTVECEPLAADEDNAAIAEDAQVVRTNLSAVPSWNTAEYLSYYQAKVANYKASNPGFNASYEIGKAFDNNWGSMYSSKVEGETTITMDFDQVEELNRFLFKSHDSGSNDGYPTKFSIRASETGEEGTYEDVVTNYESAASGQQLAFRLTTPFKAKSVQLVIHTAHGDNKARVAEIKWLRYDAVSDEVDSLFADTNRTELAEAWKSDEKLAELQTRVEAHPYASSMIGYVERARMILAGTWAANVTATRSTQKQNEGIDSEKYRATFKVPVKNATSTRPGKAGNELAKAFDDDWSTRYQANGWVQPSSITMEFDQVETIDRVLYGHGYTAQWKYGYPNKLTFSYSETGHEGSYRDVSFNASETNDTVVFKLSQPVKAKFVRLTITDIHGGGNGWQPAATEIKILRYDELPVIFDDLFADSSSLTLKDKYNSEEVLTELQTKLDVHPNKDELADALKRAWGVYRGEVIDQNDRRDWPVHVIQKTGPDTKRINWLFYGEGYTYDQQDKFLKDITERVTRLMQVEPYRSMAPYMNLYAMCVESNESGVSTKTATVNDDRDTFFKVTYTGTIVASPGNRRAAELNKWFTENYLDEGATLMHSTVLSNTNIYFGAGTEPSSASLAAGEMMVGHEAAHIFAGLADEYAPDSWQRGDIGGTNLTSNGNPETVRWKSFLGHRGTTMVQMAGIGGGRYCWKAKGDCLMNSYNGREFCEICRESVFRRLNNNLKKEDQAPMYVAQPELTIVRTEEEKAAGTGTGVAATDNAGKAKIWDAGPVISEANIERANGRQLQYRTVVSNYRDTNQDVTLKLKITGADGTVKYEKEQTSSVHPNTVIPADMYPQDKIDGVAIQDTRQAGAVSLTIVTPELTGLAAGDKIDASVWYDGKLMGTVGNPSWGTVRISYKLVDNAGNVIGDVPGYGVQENRIYAGQNELGDVPNIYGYTYTGSSLDEGAFLAEAGKVSNIERYYKVSSATVTKQLVDVNGNVMQTKSERVAIGEKVVPAASDFTVAAGYKVVAPAAVTMGTEDIVLTYTYERDEELYAQHGNVAQGKKASVHWAADGSVAPNDGGRPASQAVDGVSNDINNYVGFGADSRNEPSYLQVDLGNVYELKNAEGGREGAIKMWRYWADGRTYNGTVIVASRNGTFEEGDRTVIYNSDAEGTMGFGCGTDKLYKETNAGLSIDLPEGGPVYARYVRVYMNGRAGGNTNHINELQVMGSLADLKDELAAELNEWIEALSKKVESGLYEPSSMVAAEQALLRARAAITQGVTEAKLKAFKNEFTAADKKLRRKDASEGSIQYLGGSLRYSDDAASTVDGLRMGFWFRLPEGAEPVKDESGWYYGLGEVDENLFRKIEKYVEVDEGGFVANAVLTQIPAAHYDTLFAVRAKLTYTLNGEKHVVESTVVNKRSVDGVATKIDSSSAASDREKKFARDILNA